MSAGLNGVTMTQAVWYTPVKTKEEALESFYKGRDWVIRNVNHPDCGRYCSFRDANIGDRITLRYNKNRNTVIFTVEGVEDD